LDSDIFAPLEIFGHCNITGGNHYSSLIETQVTFKNYILSLPNNT